MRIKSVTNSSSAKTLALMVTVIGMITFAIHSEGFAASESQSSSWNSNPNWAVPDSQPRVGSSVQSRKSKQKAASPFAPGSHNVALELGQAFLMGDLGNKYTDSINYQLHYTYGASEIFGFDSSLGHSSHSDSEFSMTSLNAGLRINMAWFDRVIPYATAGLGFYRPSRRVTPTNSVSEVLFGIHLGPGVSLQLTQDMFFGTSLTFHDVFGTTKQTANGNVDLGGTYTTFLLHAGLTF